MEKVKVLHMNKGVGETSYAMNSTLQNKLISFAKPATQKAIEKILCSSWEEKMGIADLGCSSGPNVLRVISEILDAVYATAGFLDSPAPELMVYLNDLFNNDFNNIFASLPSFYKKQRQEKGSGFGSCFVSAVPGTFYGRLFPTNSLHFVHSSNSLHWLSQVPSGLKDGNGRALNKGKVYISKNSPKCVIDVYSQQFKNDFSVFLISRSQEMVDGGRMVLSLWGRKSMDPTITHSCFQWDFLAHVLMTMVYDGLVEEEKLDCFDVPYYGACIEELKLVIENEGSFFMEDHEAYEMEWGSGMELQCDSQGVLLSRGELVARTARAVIEPMLEAHFGYHIMDELFRRYALMMEDCLSKTRVTFVNLVISLVKQ